MKKKNGTYHKENVIKHIFNTTVKLKHHQKKLLEVYFDRISLASDVQVQQIITNIEFFDLSSKNCW